MPPAAGRPRADKESIDALSALVQALRLIQISQGDHPWLLLDLTMVQLKALLLLVETGGLRSRELADGLGIAPSAATPLVDRLVGQRLARRLDDPDDRRIVRIHPTPKAVSLHGRLMRMNRSVFADVFEGLPAGERERVHRSVRLLLQSARTILNRPRGPARRTGGAR